MDGTRAHFEVVLATSTSWETGTWIVEYVWFHDGPGNERHYTSAAALNARFPSGRTIAIVP